MANPNLYLHEIIHIVGTGSEAYKLHTGERRPTLLFNGYGDYVAGLYTGLENERLWA